MKDDLKIPWVEKYRPTRLEDIILPASTKEKFEDVVEEGADQLNNYLFTGLSGIGKTTLAKALIEALGVKSSMYINASDENGIETVRNKISQFCSTQSADGNVKIIILDEADGISFQGQKALNNIIEKSVHVRFIFTCNYPERVIPAIKSRLTPITFRSLDKKAIWKRCVEILRNEKIKVPDEEQKKNFKTLIKRCYPDMRKTINQLQHFSKKGVLKIDFDEVVSEDVYDTLLELIGTKQASKLRELLVNNKMDYDGIMKKIFHDLLAGKNIFGDVNEGRVVEMLIYCGEYTRYSNEVVDKEMNFVEFVLQIIKLVKKVS